eukprot:scaffold3598_cov115-Cylindrotheca_fusiformis.AAC.2
MAPCSASFPEVERLDHTLEEPLTNLCLSFLYLLIAPCSSSCPELELLDHTFGWSLPRTD